MNAKVEAILAKKYPTFQEPFAHARAWNREKSDESLKLAEELARGLKERYPHVLQVRFELAFSLVQQKRRAEAIAELELADREFPVLDEDCLSLRGRCHKDEGDELLHRGFLAEAEREYRNAEDYYQKAYELRQDRFPGINVAALRLIRASLLRALIEKEPGQVSDLRERSDDLLRQATDLARTLLRNTESEPNRIPDNDIWGWATEADVHLILQEWDKAEFSYRRALSNPSITAHHPDTMKTQVHRLLTAFGRLGIVPQGPLTNPDDFFAVKK